MTENPDPYRYGYPPPPAQTSGPTGRLVVSASWQLLRQDRELIWLPVISALLGTVAAAVLFLPGFEVGRSIGRSDQVGGYVGAVLAAFALSVVSIYFQAALVIGAFMRADGQQPTIGLVLRATWKVRRQVLAWAIVTTTVGAVIRMVEERLGILGKLLGLLGGIAWAIASFFVVPVIVAEGLGPVAGVKRSAQLIRDTWGTSVRTSLRVGFGYLLALLPIVVLFVVGIGQAVTGSLVVGVMIIAVAALASIVLGAVVSAVTTYARALIYRYAAGLPVPGISPYLLAGAFTVKRRRWGRHS